MKKTGGRFNKNLKWLTAGRIKLAAPLATVLITVITIVILMTTAGTGSSFTFMVHSEDCGLVVTTAEEAEDTDNLNPGDLTTALLLAENTKEDPLNYYFNIEKVDSAPGFYPGLEGRPLQEALEITIARGEEKDFQGTVSDFIEKYAPGGMEMGLLEGNTSQEIDISTYLPGPDTGNEFQNARVALRFEFRAECEDEDNGEPSNGPRPPRRGASLVVQKFHDLDRSGTWEENEPEIEGWEVEINGRRYETPVSLRNLNPGTYEIREIPRQGWEATTEELIEVELSRRETKTVVFGNYQEVEETATLEVRKYHDLDGDGSWGENEPEIMDWKIDIEGVEYLTPVVLELEPGEYTVAEEEVEGWKATTEPVFTVDLLEGEMKTIHFGNQYMEDAAVLPEVPEIDPDPVVIDPETPEIEPEDDPELPTTGEIPPYVYYIAGLFLLAAGLLLWRRSYIN